MIFSKKSFLWVYASVPAGALLIACDSLLWGHVIRDSLPKSPHSLVLYNCIFDLPHIFASLFTFVDKEYFRHYRRLLALTLLFALGITVLLPAASGGLYYTIMIYAALTGYHVAMQQAGIGRMILGLKEMPDNFRLWRASLAVATVAGFIAIYARAIDLRLFSAIYPGPMLILTALPVVTGLFLLPSFRRQAVGQLYMAGVVVQLAFVMLCALAGYELLLLLSIRIVHDITAFMIYINHDTNRNAQTRHQLFYRIFGGTRLPVYVLCPAMAMLLTLPVNLMTEKGEMLAAVLMTASIMHYTLEGFVWKRGSPHRRHLKVAA